MLSGMSTIEIIENLKIKKLPKIGWYDGSDDCRRTSDTQIILNSESNILAIPLIHIATAKNNNTDVKLYHVA